MNISAQKRDAIISRINDRPRSAAAKAAGVSLSTFYRVVRECGGVLNHALSTRHPAWWDDYVREHYPHEKTKQIAQQLGTTCKLINTIARALGVKHSEILIKQYEKERNLQLNVNRQKVNHEARVETWKKTRRRDELRSKYGLSRQTKFRYRVIPQRIAKVLWRLKVKYNYIQDKSHQYTLLFTADTHRIKEQYYENKYGIKFKSQ